VITGVWAVSVMPTSPMLVTVPAAVAELFDVVGSGGDVDVTLAVLARVAPVAVDAAIVPVAVMVTAEPAPSSSIGIAHSTAGVGWHVPAVVVTDVIVTPAGTVSDRVTPDATDGPLFVTTIV
jgi:hypothetical protein